MSRSGARSRRGLAGGLLAIVLTLLAPGTTGAAEPVFDLRAEVAAAGPGATVQVPAGTYRGPVTIDRPVRLIGAPGAMIDGGGHGSVVDIRVPDVEFAGFIVRHSGTDILHDEAGIHISAPRAFVHDNTIVDTLHGIYVKAATDCRIERNVIRGRAQLESVPDPIVSGLKLTPEELCSTKLEQNQRGNGIHLWKCRRITLVGNDIRGTRDGMYFSFTSDTRARGNRISEVRYGLHYMYSDRNEFEDNTFYDNAAGAALMFSRGLLLRHNRFVANRSERAYGLLLQSVDDTTVEENIIEGNTVGLFLESNNDNHVLRNRIAGNYIGLRISDSSQANVFAENSFVRNLHPIETSGANASNLWTDGAHGNHWDDAIALDLNGDGIADVAHREADVFGAWRRVLPAIGLLSGSPGERLVRFIYSRIPVRGISGITDSQPLVRSVAP